MATGIDRPVQDPGRPPDPQTPPTLSVKFICLRMACASAVCPYYVTNAIKRPFRDQFIFWVPPDDARDPAWCAPEIDTHDGDLPRPTPKTESGILGGWSLPRSGKGCGLQEETNLPLPNFADWTRILETRLRTFALFARSSPLEVDAGCFLFAKRLPPDIPLSGEHVSAPWLYTCSR